MEKARSCADRLTIDNHLDPCSRAALGEGAYQEGGAGGEGVWSVQPFERDVSKIGNYPYVRFGFIKD